jgi:DNA-binding NarL/FixJ family response regulator
MHAPTPSRTRVLLADRAGPARRALAALLADLDDVELVGEVDDREDVAPALARTHAEVLVIDDRLLAGDQRLPDRVRAIVVGLDGHPGYVARARALGADAWVYKDDAGENLPPLLERT